MKIQFAALAGLGLACVGCSAPAVQTALAGDNPANPDAASVPFVRPIDVLSLGGTPPTAVPSTAMTMSGGAMPGMDMSGGPTAGMGYGSMAGMRGDMPGMTMGKAAPGKAGQAAASGTVNAVDPARHSINVTHQPIKALGWPSMTMDFPVAASVDLSAIRPGEKVDFVLGRPDTDGNRRIEQVAPAAGHGGGGMPGMDMKGHSQ